MHTRQLHELQVGCVRIDCPIECEAVLESFYTAVESGDTSSVILDSTNDVIQLNSSSYTAWFWRRKCILSQPDALTSTLLLSERDYVDDWCCRNPKNYQIWFHRRWLVHELRVRNTVPIAEIITGELESTDCLIELEPKHYNAWSHRLYLVTISPNILMGELSFADKFIDEDVRNNSAWSYRREIVRRVLETTSLSPEDSHTFLQSEVSYCMQKIKLAPSNESPWVYLRSFGDEFLSSVEVEQLCRSLIAQNIGELSVDLRHCADTLGLIIESQGRLAEYMDLLNKLIEADPIRANILRLRGIRVTSNKKNS